MHLGGDRAKGRKTKVLLSAILLLLIFSGTLFASFASVGAAPAMSLDGSARNGCGYATSCSVSLTTTSPADVVIVGCDCWPMGASFSVKDTAGLTFLPRTAQVGIGGGQFIQTWYAVTTTALTADSVSVQTPSTGETWYGVVAFAVSGANTANPFDPNPILPRTQANINCPGSYPCNTGVSTIHPSFVFQFGGDTGGTLQTAGAGFTLIQGNTADQDAYAQYEITSSPLSSATLSFGTSQVNDFGTIADALQPGATSTSSTSSTTSSSTTSVSPPSLDGSAKNGCGYVTSCSLSLSTANPSDVVIVGCDCWPMGASFSVKDTAGLTFLPRTAQVGIGGGQFIQTWYAITPTQLTGDTISVQTTLTGETWYGVIAFGVSGANLQNPFDSNPSLPKAQANINCPGSYPCNIGVSTTSGNDLVFQFGGDTSYLVETAGTGFTLIQGNTADQDAYAQYEITSSPLSSATLSFGTSQGNDFGTIADALQPGATSTLHTTTTGVAPSSASVTVGNMIVFAATVTDMSSSPGTPTGAVSWSDGGAGGSFSIPSCTLAPLGSSSSSCAVTYTAPSTPGVVTLTASYAGDGSHSGSSGASQLTVNPKSTSTLALDSSAHSECGGCGTTSVTITTNNANDVIVATFSTYDGRFVGISDSAGLTWHQRAQLKQPLSGTDNWMYEYYAVSTSKLSGDKITIACIASCHPGLNVFGVSGANIGSPFDPGAGVPARNGGGLPPTSVTYTTTNANDFIFVSGSDENVGNPFAAESGYTLIQGGGTGSGADSGAEYEVVSTAQSSVSSHFADAGGADWVLMADAVQQASSSQDPTSTSVAPNPSTVSIGNPIVFTASVTDTSNPASTPTGSISWSDGGAGGSFSGSSSCTLSSGACSITYTAPPTPGTVTISASYGDPTHSASNGASSLTVTSSSTEGDWTSLIFDNQDSRYQANSSITSANVGQIQQKWVVSTQQVDGFSVTSTPVILAGNVYFADWGGNVYSVSISTGQLNWKVNLGSTPISSTLALANGMVYVGDGIGTTEVFALSQTDGHTVWARPLPTSMNAVFASPIVFNGLVYIGVACECDEMNASMRGAIFALNALTGSVVWTFDTSPGSDGGAGVWGSVVIDPALDSIYFGTSNQYGNGTDDLYSYSIISLNAATGTLNWYYQVYHSLIAGDDNDFGSTPNLFSVTMGGVTYNAIGLGMKSGTYYILDRTNGHLLQKDGPITSAADTGIVGLAGFIYLGANNPEIFITSLNYGSGIIWALTPSTATVNWSFDSAGDIQGSVVVIPGAVLFGDLSGNLYALSTTSGQPLFQTSFSSPIYGGITEAEGYIFVPTSTGVYAFAT